jgi:hypothetical protein
MSNAKAPKCPKNKALFSAVTPEGDVFFRSSARDYTHALAVFSTDKPAWEDTHWARDLVDGAAPEGFEILNYGRDSRIPGGIDKTLARVGRRVADIPAHWSIISFHGSAALAEKSISQWSFDGYRVVPVEVVEDRRA